MQSQQPGDTQQPLQSLVQPHQPMQSQQPQQSSLVQSQQPEDAQQPLQSSVQPRQPLQSSQPQQPEQPRARHSGPYVGSGPQGGGRSYSYQVGQGWEILDEFGPVPAPHIMRKKLSGPNRGGWYSLERIAPGDAWF